MTKMKKAFVFDFDDTLAKTKCKINIYWLGLRIRQITPEEFNSYKLGMFEYFNFDEFRSSDFIHEAQPLLLLRLAKEVYDESHSVYVLTAREDDVSDAIAAWLKQHGIKPKTIFCVGGTQKTISKNKRRILLSIMEEYDKVYFYDDCPNNIENAPNGKNLRKYKV